MNHLGLKITDPAFDLTNFPEVPSEERLLEEESITDIQLEVDKKSRHTLDLEEETEEAMEESPESDEPDLKSKGSMAYKFSGPTRSLPNLGMTTRSKSRSSRAASSQADALEADSSSPPETDLEQPESADGLAGDPMELEDVPDQSISSGSVRRQQPSRAGSKRHRTSPADREPRQHSQDISNTAGSTDSKRARGNPEVEDHTSKRRIERRRGRGGR
ncbi:hypothetical protein CONPUDRAFT_152356 [Coniophora puteana RWD-64-598 SS2]|uniref:Uncharacterized protein n=1 Tax=Coniophora puteana (strain RWD-64-598) TaxID=741705 RepID=A0A5M3MVZ7_CONPW|nr:uncharacterized protein CONPUDRAFT_152356 [Coniophora puteana RWD-64-598 SS2]EIW83329.1 hypothetical protein CONPUDRAFT_152356 [Coniophora puteana RWD-64-598 SS2]